MFLFCLTDVFRRWQANTGFRRRPCPGYDLGSRMQSSHGRGPRLGRGGGRRGGPASADRRDIPTFGTGRLNHCFRTRRPARASANQVRAGDQSQDRRGTRLERAAKYHRDRMSRRAFIAGFGGVAACRICRIAANSRAPDRCRRSFWCSGRELRTTTPQGNLGRPSAPSIPRRRTYCGAWVGLNSLRRGRNVGKAPVSSARS